MQNFSSSPAALFKSIWKNRALIIKLSKRDIQSRYKGTLFGVIWSLLNPLIMLTVFTFVFGKIVQAKWGHQHTDNMLDFSVALFCGLLIYFFFSEVIGRAATTIISNANYVKKVVFPLETLLLINLLSALYHFIMSFIVLLVLLFFSTWSFSIEALWVPLIVLPFVLLMLGLSWILAALGTYFRDINQLVAPGLTALMFLSPIFYPLSSVHDRFLWVYMINPLTFVIEQLRSVLINSMPPNFLGLFLYYLVSFFVLYVGYLVFQNTRKGFADVL